ncbi:MAG TPA: RodZ domain-containing protein [Candidatus Limnocylindrales bacterium]
MTSRDHARRTGGESRAARVGAYGDLDESLTPRPSLPDRLAAARERKGVDLTRAERDTKIRARYLSALERGDYRDLPGAVYTKGFLRNYALYLGLDPEDVLRQWRRERGDAGTPEAVIVPPRPMAEPKRPLTFSPSVIVAALMTFGVVAFGIYLSVQLLRYAKPPELSVTSPSPASITVEETLTSYRIAGTATPGALISITAPGRDQPYRVNAAVDGSWSIEVDLRRGQNRFDVTATSPDTGKQADVPRQIVITVPFAAVQAPTLTVSQPVDGTTYSNGAIPVEGMTTNATSVSIVAERVDATSPGASHAPTPSSSPKPTATPRPTGTPKPGSTPGATTPPAGTSVTVNDDGTFSTPLELTAGTWRITITATSDQGQTASVTRTVTVAYKGVTLVVAINGGNAWIKVWVDGSLAPGTPQSGRTYHDGDTVVFTGKTSVEVRTGNSGNTSFTLNGVSLGSLGKVGIPETWLFQPPNAPVKTNRT